MAHDGFRFIPVAATALALLLVPATAPEAQNVLDYGRTPGDIGLSETGEYFKLTRTAGGALRWVPTTADDPDVVNAERVIYVERYRPIIWVDPDGCEHWVMDDGFEGYMSPHLRRDGTPVCNRG